MIFFNPILFGGYEIYYSYLISNIFLVIDQKKYAMIYIIINLKVKLDYTFLKNLIRMIYKSNDRSYIFLKQFLSKR